MARQVDYDAKIAAIDEKIVAKKAQLKKLKEQKKSLILRKAKNDNAELVLFMQENKISAADVVSKLKQDQ